MMGATVAELDAELCRHLEACRREERLVKDVKGL